MTLTLVQISKRCQNTNADTLYILITVELNEPNPPEKDVYEHGYAMFEQVLNIHVDSSKHNPVPPVGISNINATNDNIVQNKDIQDIKTLLSPSTRDLID